MTTRVLLAACACCALAVLAACNDDDAGGGWPCLAALWPHADGSAWTYEACRQTRGGAVVLPAELPTLEQAHAALAAAPPGTLAAADTAVYTFALDGTFTTPGGLTVQAVVNTLEWTDDHDGGFSPVGSMATPLLGGEAFAFRDGGYYRYGDFEAAPNWVYLEGPPRPGTEFERHWPAGQIFARTLKGRVWSVADRTIGGVDYRDVVECVYVYDLGEADAGGATVRNHLAGRVWYAPGVGPVAWQEQVLLISRTAYDPEGVPLCLAGRGVLLEAVLPGAD